MHFTLDSLSLSLREILQRIFLVDIIKATFFFLFQEKEEIIAKIYTRIIFSNFF